MLPDSSDGPSFYTTDSEIAERLRLTGQNGFLFGSSFQQSVPSPPSSSRDILDDLQTNASNVVRPLQFTRQDSSLLKLTSSVALLDSANAPSRSRTFSERI